MTRKEVDDDELALAQNLVLVGRFDRGGRTAMTDVILELTTSLDGFVAGPNAALERPLGEGGESLHEWMVGLESFRTRHGMAGGTAGPDSDLVAKSVAATGAVVMGRRMFSGGAGPWDGDPNARGWWGDTPPFGVPVFVVTHHAREPLVLQGGTTFTFVTEGIDSAIEQARAAAAARDVSLAGGADVAQQALRAGLVDEVRLHLAPLLLGSGVRLFEDLGDGVRLELAGAIDSPAVTHLRYRVTGR